MSNEITHILRGVFLFLAVAIVIRLFLFVSSIPKESYGREIPDVEVIISPPLSELAKKGERIFKANCASCHSINKNLTGPALAGVESRWANRKLLNMWIRNWRKAVATGDSYARKMKDWSPVAMNMFELINDKDIEAILAYVKESSNSRYSPIP